MSPRLMSSETRKALASLPINVRRDFEAWFRNALQVMTGSNSMEADETRFSHLIRGYARQRIRAAELALEDLHEILGVDSAPDPNAHLGALADMERCEKVGGE